MPTATSSARTSLLLILGGSALLLPIAVASGALKRDSVVMVAVTVVFALLALVTPLGRLIGAAFVAALAVCVFMASRQERQSAPAG